jgi:hypothetical protein
MKKVLISDGEQSREKLHGVHAGLTGDLSGLYGDCTGLSGDCSGLYGDCTGIKGNLDLAELTSAERKRWVHILDLTSERNG